MKVEQIYSRNVIHARRSCSLQEAAKLMREHHVGALLVTDEEQQPGRAIGIVTDRDLVLQAVAEGIGPKELTVGEVMSRGPITVPMSADIHEAMETMREHGVRRLAVSGGNAMLVGVVSLDDIVHVLAGEFATLDGIIRTEREREIVVESAANIRSR
jgi:CBS domain-containing protein